MALSVGPFMAEVQRQPVEESIVENSLKAGLRFADFVHQVYSQNDEGRKTVLFQLHSRYAHSSIRRIDLKGSQLKWVMTIHYQAADILKITEKFLTNFKSHNTPPGSNLYQATALCVHPLALSYLTNLGRYNFIPPQFWEEFNNESICEIAPIQEPKGFFAYHIEKQNPFLQILLVSYSSRPRVNLIHNFAKNTLYLIVFQLKNESFKEFWDDFKGVDLMRVDQMECTSPKGISDFFDRMFKQFIVPKEAQTAIRDSIAKVPA